MGNAHGSRGSGGTGRLSMRIVAVGVMAVSLSGACQDGVEVEAIRPRGTYIVVPPAPEESATRFGPGPAHRIIYLNKNGISVTRGRDNSSNDVSSVPNGAATVSAWSYGADSWTRLVDCVRDVYAPFDVTITDVDPGATAHVESVVGGRPGQVGLPNNVGGVSPFANDCSVIERSIVYTFAEVYGGDVQAICETVAQETAHSFGLDHEMDCRDPMTYLRDCGAKSFQDADANCGEDGARACACGGTTQNSYRILMQVLGSGEADVTPPDLSILKPLEGETVAPGFSIEGTASDADSGVGSVTLYIDAMEWATDTSAPYAFVAPEALAAGPHTIELRAADLDGNLTPRSVSVTLDDGSGTGTDPGTDPGTGGTGEPPLPGEGNPSHAIDMGAPCATADECSSGFCSGAGFCSEACDPGNTSPCGAGFECAAYESGGGECLPLLQGSIQGGCQLAPGQGGGVAGLGLGQGLMLAIAMALACYVGSLGGRRRRGRRSGRDLLP